MCNPHTSAGAQGGRSSFCAPVGRSLGSVDELISQALGDGLDVAEGGLTGASGQQPDSLCGGNTACELNGSSAVRQADAAGLCTSALCLAAPHAERAWLAQPRMSTCMTTFAQGVRLQGLQPSGPARGTGLNVRILTAQGRLVWMCRCTPWSEHVQQPAMSLLPHHRRSRWKGDATGVVYAGKVLHLAATRVSALPLTLGGGKPLMKSTPTTSQLLLHSKGPMQFIPAKAAGTLSIASCKQARAARHIPYPVRA